MRELCARARRPAAPAAHGPHHRHQRQGLGRPAGHRAARRARPHGRHLHEPPPRGDQRADRPQRRADLRRRRSPPCSPTWPASSRCSTHRPSYFELLTAAAFRWFSDEAVAAAVVEVGLLGRWDATNVVDGVVAVLTNVGHDHTDGQGDWRRRIAEEKAGIVKPGVDLRARGDRSRARRTSSTRPPAAEVWRRDVDFALHRRTGSPSAGGCSTCARPGGSYDEVFLAAARRAPGRERRRSPWPPRRRSSAARSTRPRSRRPSPTRHATPGRFEVVQRDPLLILDGAHNPDGAQAVAETLAEGFVGDRRPPPGRRRARRPRPGRAPRDPRRRVGGRGRVLHARLAARPARPPRWPSTCERARWPRPASSPTSARRSSAALAAADADDVVLVTGSLYTVGAARAACRRRGLLRRVADRPCSRWRRVGRPRSVPRHEPDLRDVQARRRRARARGRDRLAARAQGASRSSPPSCARSTRPSPRSTTRSTSTSRSSASSSRSSPARRCSR